MLDHVFALEGLAVGLVEEREADHGLDVVLLLLQAVMGAENVSRGL